MTEDPRATGAQPQPPRTRSDARLAPRALLRTVLLVHGTGWLFAAAGVALWRFLDSPEQSITVLTLGWTAAFVLVAWSVVMAVRASAADAKLRWPFAFCLLALTEVTLFWALLPWMPSQELKAWTKSGIFRWGLDAGLPLLLPFFWITLPILGPFAWWRVRRAEKKQVAFGPCPPWPRARRWRRGLLWYVVPATLLACLLLPVPLVVSGARLGCGRWLVAALPSFAQRHALQVCRRRPNLAPAWEVRLLGDAWLHDDILTECIAQGSDLETLYAVTGLCKANPQEVCLAVERRLRDGPPIGESQGESIGWQVGSCGPSEGLRRLLKLENAPPDFLGGLLYALVCRPRQELRADLEHLVKTNIRCWHSGLRALRLVSSQEQFLAFAHRLVQDSVAAERPQVVVKVLWNTTDRPDEWLLYVLLLAQFLEEPDVEARRAALASAHCYLYRGLDTTDPPLLQALRRAFRLLEDDDVVVRRGATLWLAQVYRLDLSNTPAMIVSGETPHVWNSSPESTAERAERKTLRQALQARLGGP